MASIINGLSVLILFTGGFIMQTSYGGGFPVRYPETGLGMENEGAWFM